ncbi:hypothetical protein XC_3486 [Xanthomonas campestris pv. campestris str. 8004]|uniref:Uncharacterized protein n=1 Tax=Xanthomonas campestris pv. campestris (strain 8004) TaxID=314565 RepID=A0A0H2XAW1_XANC8|nr:hypothetical protein XC_3486 [Xanthomonas campestris pv. campestris str. 8004]
MAAVVAGMDAVTSSRPGSVRNLRATGNDGSPVQQRVHNGSAV